MEYRRGSLWRKVVAVLAGCLAIALLAGCATNTDARPASGPHLRGVVPATPIPKADFVLTDTAGHPFDFARETAGYVTLLYFGYTHCPDVCPANMAAIATALRNLPPAVEDRVKVVFVTVDPERDTGPVLREWLNHFSYNGHDVIGLTGSEEEIARAEAAFGVPPALKEQLGNGTYGVSHAGYVIVFTPDGYATRLYPEGVRAQDWAHDLPLLVKQGASNGG